MKSLCLLKRLASCEYKKCVLLTKRMYISQTNVANSNENINKSSRLETPPVISFSGIYRCSVDNPVSHFRQYFSYHQKSFIFVSS